MDFRINDESWASDLQRGVQQYTDALYESVYEDEDDGISSNTLSGIAFCGCDDCFWREALTYLVPRILEGAQEGKIALEE